MADLAERDVAAREASTATLTRTPPGPPLAEARKASPVKWWAIVGAGFLALIAYLIIAWIASGDATRTPTGPDAVPGRMHAIGIGVQIVAPCIAVLVLFLLVVRPWLRDRRVPFDGLFVLAVVTTYWQDPLANYTQAWCAYNAGLVNFGSWARHIPGIQAPNMNRFAEPLLFAPAVFLTVFLGGAMLACSLMRRARARWPRIGKVGLVALCFGCLILVETVVEPLFLMLGLYNFGGGPGPKIAAGHYYQFPLVEAPIMAAYWTCLACLRYFRDDKGQSVAERGLDGLRVTGSRRGAVRFLALAGMVNVLFLGVYNAPTQLVAVHAGPWAKDVTSRSYMMDGLCGPGTAYACAGPNVPIPRGTSAHVDPHGKLVPAGPQ